MDHLYYYFMRTFPIIVFLTLLLSACSSQTGNRELKPEDRVEVPDFLQDEAAKIERLYETREISLGDYKFRMAELADEGERLQLRMQNLSTADYLPAWAKNIGLSIPVNMEIDAQYSHMTSENDQAGMFNSVTLVYQGEYETAINEAKRIAAEANIPLSTSWQKNMEMSKKLGNPVPKGVTYMNYDFGMDQNVDYLVVVEVDPSGKLTISAADARQMRSLIDKHAVNPEN
jgi:hypothetical protein